MPNNGLTPASILFTSLLTTNHSLLCTILKSRHRQYVHILILNPKNHSDSHSDQSQAARATVRSPRTTPPPPPHITNLRLDKE